MSATPGPRPGAAPRSWTRLAGLWVPVAAYMAAIFYVQSLPSPPAPAGVGDKVLHLLGYALLGALATRATAGGAGRRVTLGAALAAVAVTSGYGITDEIHQGFVPLRTRELADWYADTAGGALGALVLAAWGILVTSRTR
ncbi:MAG: VanZ family protein [Vicinamibacterales bacterium]